MFKPRLRIASPEGQLAVQVAAAPTPIWLPRGTAPLLTPSVSGSAEQAPQQVIIPGLAGDVELVAASFAFLEPPEPGAHARLSVDVRVKSAPAGGAIALAIPTHWFDGYRLVGSQPASIVDDQSGPGKRRLLFSGMPLGQFSLLIDVVVTAERVDPPTVSMTLEPGGTLVGEAQPPTIAPRPRPGPVSALRVPRLNLRVAVIPTNWEPPAFVAGQLRNSAFVTLGNTVLVGHLGGASGDVFKDLDELQPGDKVIAVSRVLEYNFIVSQKETRSGEDSGPTAPTTSPRLTMMTCTGTWDPLTHQYSDRLWVTAEPWDLASKTIAVNASRPPTPVPEPVVATETPESGVAAGLGADRTRLDGDLGPALGVMPAAH